MIPQNNQALYDTIGKTITHIPIIPKKEKLIKQNGLHIVMKIAHTIAIKQIAVMREKRKNTVGQKERK